MIEVGEARYDKLAVLGKVEEKPGERDRVGPPG